MKMLNFPSPYQQGERPYDIFKDRMSAISSIVEGIKGRILNKYNKGLIDMTLGQLNKALDKDQQTEMINLLNADPTDIYPDDEQLNTMAGQFVDYSNIMGKMAEKEKMMGNLGNLTPRTSPMQLPGASPTTSEVMLPKGDKMQLLNAVMNMPSGQMDFAPVLNYIKEHRPNMMGSFSPMEEWALNQAMGQQVSPRDKMVKDVKAASAVSNYFAEPTKETHKYPYTEQEVKDYELYKKSLEPEETQIDFDKLNEFIEANNMKLSGVNVNPKTGNLSYSFNAKSTEKTWGEFLGEANQFIELNPDYEVTSTNPKTGSVTIEKKGTEPEGGGLKDLTGSDVNTYNKMFYGGDDDWGAITPEEYKDACTNWDAMKKNKEKPTHLSILERSLQECLGTDNTIINRGEKNKQTDEWFKMYEWIYPYYKDALKGASPKYLPPEEIKKVGGIEGAFTGGDVRKGDYGSALVADQQGKEKDDKGYIVGQTYKDEENKLWKYLGDGKFEEVKKEESSQKRTR